MQAALAGNLQAARSIARSVTLHDRGAGVDNGTHLVSALGNSRCWTNFAVLFSPPCFAGSHTPWFGVEAAKVDDKLILMGSCWTPALLDP